MHLKLIILFRQILCQSDRCSLYDMAMISTRFKMKLFFVRKSFLVQAHHLISKSIQFHCKTVEFDGRNTFKQLPLRPCTTNVLFWDVLTYFITWYNKWLMHARVRRLSAHTYFLHRSFSTYLYCNTEHCAMYGSSW